MKVALDARSIFSPRPRGTGRNLLDALRHMLTLRPDYEFTLYHRRPADECPLAADLPPADNLRIRRIDLPGDRLDAWFQLRLPLAARRDRVDLLHLPANAAPARCGVPCVVTIHDLAPLLVADEYAPRDRERFRRGVQRAVRGAEHIITVSAATRDDLHREFGVAHERMTVIHWAADDAIVKRAAGRAADADVKRVREHYALPERWLLNFSGSSARKNATGLLEGWSRAHARGETALVLTGCEPPTFRAALESRARALGVADTCRLLGFVPHADLYGLLRGAAGVVMPSLHEGFGLPILDAFAVGTPVLTSNTSSMPEVAGDAALFCDPRDRRSIATGIAKLLDAETARMMAVRGDRRVRSFTWQRTAEALCAVYDRCLSRGDEPCAPRRQVDEPALMAGR